jgi:pimeloyl-ACP methyl ester carboxylesterase
VPSLSKLIVKRAFFTPTIHKITPPEKHYLDKARGFDLILHNKLVKCWKWGEGPAILLAHGWNGRGVQLHPFIEPLIEKGYSVITYDAPGHGESQGKTSSYFEFTDTIRTLLTQNNNYGIQGIIAHSLGASATVNSIAKEGCPIQAVLIAPALRLKEILHGFFDDVGIPEPIYQELIGEYENEFGYNMHEDNPGNLLKQITSEILIVHDRDDRTIPYVDSEEISDRFQNINLYTTGGLGHKRILTDAAVVDFITNYFSRNPIQREVMKMRDYTSILDNYIAADFNERLNLFLECPSLRSRFAEIDQEEMAGASSFSPGELQQTRPEHS